MQVTLVAHYGRKPAGLAAFLRYLQNNLATSLGRAFQPYDIEQVHATIVGLEGCRADGAIRGRRSGLSIDLSGIVGFLRGDAFAPIQVRVGGYSAAGPLFVPKPGRAPVSQVVLDSGIDCRCDRLAC